MIFIASFDLFRSAPSSFGIEQFSAFIVSLIVALAGLRKLAFSRARLWDGMLLLIYFAGILFMGLKIGGHNLHGSNGLLRVFWPPMEDFVINILGFFPLSYLMMSFFLSDNRIDKLVFVTGMVLVSGIFISLLIELLQYYIPGRSSSLFDLIANGIGTFIGVVYYLFEKRCFTYDNETN
jgi:glycopeptide antibiotics resistance protein